MEKTPLRRPQLKGRPAGCTHCQKGGYLYRSVKVDKKDYKVHRVIWLLLHGEWPKGCIDHLNGHGKRFYLHHGDGLLKNDSGYRFLKRVLRNKTNIALFSLVHPDLASRIARWSSNQSRQYTAKRQYEGDDMADYAALKIKEGLDFVVMGHNHIPCKRNIGSGVYVNLGDWINDRNYAVFEGVSLELKTWANP